MQKEIGLISDIHSNYEALKIVLHLFDSLKVKRIYSLGDLTGYGPDPVPCIEALRERKIQSILGNHDAAVAQVIPEEHFPKELISVHNWTRERLSQKNLQYLKDLPQSLEEDWGYFVHGSPLRPLWEYVANAKSAFFVFRRYKYPSIILGHTHLPLLFYHEKGRVKIIPVRAKKKELLPGTTIEYSSFTYTFKKGYSYIFNPGSVGQPRDRDPRASCAVLTTCDDTLSTITWYRLDYPKEVTCERIIEEGLPAFFGHRLLEGR